MRSKTYPLQLICCSFLIVFGKIENQLGKERAAIFTIHYYVKPSGNCHLSPASDPHNEFTGKNVLIDRQGLAKTAAKVAMSVDELDKELGKSREELYGHRQRRPRPHLDDKVRIIRMNPIQ